MSVALPTQPSHRRTSLSEQTILVYAAPKTGKSEFASRFPDALFFECEPGLNHLEVFKIPSGAMIPTLQIGDLIVVNKLASVGPGDVAVFVNPCQPDIDYVKRIVATGNFSIALQPIVDLKTRKVHHYEALARFESLGRETSPYSLITFAEETGVIGEFDLAMTRRSVDLIVEAEARGGGDREWGGERGVEPGLVPPRRRWRPYHAHHLRRLGHRSSAPPCARNGATRPLRAQGHLAEPARGACRIHATSSRNGRCDAVRRRLVGRRNGP